MDEMTTDIESDLDFNKSIIRLKMAKECVKEMEERQTVLIKNCLLERPSPVRDPYHSNIYIYKRKERTWPMTMILDNNNFRDTNDGDYGVLEMTTYSTMDI